MAAPTDPPKATQAIPQVVPPTGQPTSPTTSPTTARTTAPKASTALNTPTQVDAYRPVSHRTRLLIGLLAIGTAVMVAVTVLDLKARWERAQRPAPDRPRCDDKRVTDCVGARMEVLLPKPAAAVATVPAVASVASAVAAATASTSASSAR